MGNMGFPYLMSLGCVWQVIGRVCLLRFMVQAQFDNTVQYSRERESMCLQLLLVMSVVHLQFYWPAVS